MSVGAILAFILPAIVVVWMFPEFIILLIAGEQYLDAVPVLKLSMLYGLFIRFVVQFGTILDSSGRPLVNFYFTLLVAGLNVFFNYLGIKYFGLIGAVYGTLLTYTITFGLMQATLYRLFRVKTYQVFRQLLVFYHRLFKVVLSLPARIRACLNFILQIKKGSLDP